MVKIAVVLEPCEEGGFTISVPTLPGCISEGETVDEAMENIIDAIEMRLEPVVDDLILDESFIVKELELQIVRPGSGSGPSEVAGDRSRNGLERDSTSAGARAHQQVEL